MAKIRRSLILLPVILAVLTGCGTSGETAPTNSSSAPAASSSLSEEAYQQTKSAILTSARLSAAYAGLSFHTDGMGAMQVGDAITYIDGDTTHFKEDSTLAYNYPAKIRYYGIDTPESTGSIQKWGKAASNFTHNALAAATAIVVTRPDMKQARPDMDSTSSRYLGYVWYATAENPQADDFTLLNLEIVVHGFSAMKGVAVDNPFYTAFTQADALAEQYSLHVYAPASAVDPLFYTGAARNIDMAELYTHTALYVDDPSKDFVAPNISLTGVVSAVQGDNAWIQATIAPGDDAGDADPVTYGLFLFTGYKTMKPLKTVGNEVRVTGKVSDYYGNLQLTGLTYNEFLPSTDDVKLLSTANSVVVADIADIDQLSAINQNVLVNIGTYEGDAASLDPLITAGVTITGGYGGSDEIDQKTGLNYTDNAITLYGTFGGASLTIRIDDGVIIRDKYSDKPYKPNVTSYNYFATDHPLVVVQKGITETFNDHIQITIPTGNALVF